MERFAMVLRQHGNKVRRIGDSTKLAPEGLKIFSGISGGWGLPMIDKAGHVAGAAEAVAVFQRHCGTSDEHASQTLFATSDTWRMRAAPTFSTR
jgi:hypothetical protein